MTIAQMTLSLNLREDASLANYYPSKRNLGALKILNEMAHGRGEHFTYLYGFTSVGKTHLLQACCHAANRLRLTNFYISLSSLDHLQPTIFDQLESLHLVCVDDIESISRKPEWEEAFFDFLNRMKEEKKRLIVVGNKLPMQLNIDLQDIKSRLSQAIVFQIHALSDEEKLKALQLRAKSLGLKLSSEVAQFLLHHCARDMGSLFSSLEKLDKVLLETQHKLTIPFVKSALDLR